MADDARAKVLDELALKSAPRLAKCSPEPSRRAECEERAAAAYRAAWAAVPAEERSLRKCADAIERSHRMHIDYGTGARSIPVDVVLLLPSAARVRFIAELGRSLPRDERTKLLGALLTELNDEDEDTARCA